MSLRVIWVASFILSRDFSSLVARFLNCKDELVDSLDMLQSIICIQFDAFMLQPT